MATMSRVLRSCAWVAPISPNWSLLLYVRHDQPSSGQLQPRGATIASKTAMVRQASLPERFQDDHMPDWFVAVPVFMTAATGRSSICRT
jgi:hypothetical protein